jgi:hypothetical protein
LSDERARPLRGARAEARKAQGLCVSETVVLSASRVPRHDAPARVALALGLAGALGEELLAALVASPRYRLVQVALKQMITSAASKYRPWVPGTSIIAADEAFLCITGSETHVPAASPVQTYDAAQLLAAAALARSAGVRKLVVVAPLAALLQLNAAAHTVSSEQELALVDMRFASLLIVRPTQEDAAAAGGPWLGRTVAAMGRAVLDIKLPSQVQALRPRTAALAILTAAERAGDGVSVIGARELAAIVAETLPELAPKRLRLR